MASAATLKKQGNALVTLFIKEFTEKHKMAPKINRYKAQWGFQAMVEDLGYDRAQEVITYYFRTTKQGHPVEYLHMNYEKIAEYMEERKRDDRMREELRRETEARLKELGNV